MPFFGNDFAQTGRWQEENCAKVCHANLKLRPGESGCGIVFGESPLPVFSSQIMLS
jgi:hypothetical protein